MCFPCIQLLITVYNFKTRCLNTETIIRSYIQRNNLTEYNHVNLSCVVQELIRLNNHFRGAQNKIKAETQHPNNTHSIEKVDEKNDPIPQMKENDSISENIEENGVENQTEEAEPIAQETEPEIITQRDLEEHQISSNNSSELQMKEEHVAQFDVPENQMGEQVYPFPHVKEGHLPQCAVPENQMRGPPCSFPQVKEIPTQSHTHQHNYAALESQIPEQRYPFPQAKDSQRFPYYSAGANQNLNHFRGVFCGPPQLREREKVTQYRIPVNHMGQRIFPFPQTNADQRVVPYSIPEQGQMGERFYPHPPTHMEHRVVPYNVPGAQIGERIYSLPPANMEHRIPHYSLPGNQMGERMYAVSQTNLDRRIAQYGMYGGHIGERIHYPQMREQIVAQLGNYMGARQFLPPQLPKEPNIVEYNAPQNGTMPADSVQQVESQQNFAQPQADSNNTKEANVTGRSLEETRPVSNGLEMSGNLKVHPVQNSLKLVIKIDKSRITNIEPYDKNEDSNEKENEQQDVEMKENGM